MKRKIKCDKDFNASRDLFSAINKGDINAVKKSIEDGADINSLDEYGRTPLMNAVIEKRHDITKLLVELGANVNIQDKRNWTALHFAAQEYDLVSTKLLVQSGANVNAQDNYGNSVISRAAFSARENGDVIKFLRNHGADIYIKNNSGISALDLAETISNYDVLKFFVDK